MNFANLLILCFAIVFSNPALCTTFDERGVAFDLPAGFNTRAPVSVTDNGLQRSFIWQIGNSPPVALHVQLTWLTDEEKKLGRTLTADSPGEAAGHCLGLDMEKMKGVVNSLALTDVREIRLSRKLGGVASFSAVAQTSRDRELGWDKLRVLIYCVSEPKREIVFRIIGSANQANDVFNGVARAIESVVITDE